MLDVCSKSHTWSLECCHWTITFCYLMRRHLQAFSTVDNRCSVQGSRSNCPLDSNKNALCSTKFQQTSYQGYIAMTETAKGDSDCSFRRRAVNDIIPLDFCVASFKSVSWLSFAACSQQDSGQCIYSWYPHNFFSGSLLAAITNTFVCGQSELPSSNLLHQEP